MATKEGHYDRLMGGAESRVEDEGLVLIVRQGEVDWHDRLIACHDRFMSAVTLPKPPGPLREGVRTAYSRAAESPTGDHPFPIGRGFAESIGYPAAELDTLPATASEVFAGVSNVSLRAEIPVGATVLDLGCGAGLDSLIAARKTGPEGRVLGVDFSEQMIERARRAVAEAGIGNIELLQGPAEQLPLDAAVVDVALVNGIFNLNPARAAIFAELARVLKPGGVVFAAELVLTAPRPEPSSGADSGVAAEPHGEEPSNAVARGNWFA